MIASHDPAAAFPKIRRVIMWLQRLRGVLGDLKGWYHRKTSRMNRRHVPDSSDGVEIPEAPPSSRNDMFKGPMGDKWAKLDEEISNI